jgi:ribonuclease H / adenosylcobalamin/alpha-ribazole phosphatase
MDSNATGRLILVRHGESVGNRERVFTATPNELALTDEGRQQAAEAAVKIGTRFKAEMVISSPYLRARDTARIIAAGLELPMRIEEHLHERDMGDLKGQPYDAVMKQPDYDPAQHWIWKPPGGESFEDVKRRTAPILDRLAREHAGRDVVVVSHGGVMLSLWAHVTGSWEHAIVAPNCGIIVIEHTSGRYGHPKILND